MIHAVLFDLYETLITESRSAPTRAASLAATLGLPNDAYRREWKARRGRVVLGELSFAGALTEISIDLAGRADRDAIQDICDQRVREKAALCASVESGIAALVASLGQRGITLAVVSNAFAEDVASWSNGPLAPAFHDTAFSCDERVAKPDPAIYQRTLRRLDVDPANALYIGDGGDHELEGAARVGLRVARAAWFVQRAVDAKSWRVLTSPAEVLELVAAT